MKKYMKIFLAVLAAITMTACGSAQKADEIQDTKPSAEETESSDTKDGKVNIRFILQEVASEPIVEAVNKFMEENPDINVELVPVLNFDTMKQNVLASNQAGDDFDIMYVNHVDTLSYVKGEIIRSLEEFAEADGIDYTEIMFPSMLEGCMYKDELYSVPASTDTRVLAVNKDLFEKYGLSYPKTQSEMLEAAKALTVDGNFGFVNAMTLHSYVPEYEQGIFLLGNGGRLYEMQDGKAIAAIDTKEMKDYLNFNLELLKYMPKDSLTMVDDAARRAFITGNIGMYIFGPWEYTLLPDLPFEYELITVPAGTKESASTSGGYQLAIGNGSKHPEAAWKLIKYLTTDKESLVAISIGALPVSESAYTIEPFSGAEYDIFEEQLQTSYLPEVPVPNLQEVVEEFNIYWQDVLYKKISVDEACAKAQVSVQKLLDKNN